MERQEDRQRTERQEDRSCCVPAVVVLLCCWDEKDNVHKRHQQRLSGDPLQRKKLSAVL